VSISRPAAIIVLAAGEGTRMKSSQPKVLHPIGGRSLLGHVVAAAQSVEPQQVIAVVGHGRESVTAHLAEIAPTVHCVVQESRNGTGHAVRIALAGAGLDGARLADAGLELPGGPLVVVCGDTPLLTGETLDALLAVHAAEGNAVTLLTAVLDDPSGYGRVIRSETDGAVARIVEHVDATPRERELREINAGIYAFEPEALRSGLAKLTAVSNAQGEEYLTDVIGLAVAAGHRVGAVVVPDSSETLGINDRVQLARARRMLNDRITRRWMLAGVTIVDPASTWIDVEATLEPDAVILPNTRLLGRTAIAAGAVVGPDCTLTNTEVGIGAQVRSTTADSAIIGTNATVGPYTYLRPGTRLGRAAKAGAYVEIKASDIGDGSKVPHLSYVGDATVGVGSNIGAATVIVNYDGRDKHRTDIGDYVRVGSDTMLVAPVSVGDGAYTAAGSVITADVPPGALAVARGRQRNIEGWVVRCRPGSSSAEAALAAEETQR
jgi:bifunctional UDP-N-acetylglucosamine pyrophosphorylase / glucosamine-1-phosphate N-acetyltransferase